MANEKRLIDKDELIKLCDSPHWCVWMSEIDDFPTVDAVEVVRCKDCKRYVENKEAFVTYCNRGLRNVYAKPDDFCSYGERKDNGG